MTTKVKKIIFWIIIAVVLVGLFFLLVNVAPWFYAGLVLGWIGRILYGKYIAREE